jgi:hypothetical protein
MDMCVMCAIILPVHLPCHLWCEICYYAMLKSWRSNGDQVITLRKVTSGSIST